MVTISGALFSSWWSFSRWSYSLSIASRYMTRTLAAFDLAATAAAVISALANSCRVAYCWALTRWRVPTPFLMRSNSLPFEDTHVWSERPSMKLATLITTCLTLSAGLAKFLSSVQTSLFADAVAFSTSSISA